MPPGQHPPFAVVPPEDHDAYILIATAIGLACVLLFLGIRVFVRQTVSLGFGLDDTFLGAATLLAIIQSTLLFIACSPSSRWSCRVSSPCTVWWCRCSSRVDVSAKLYSSRTYL